KQLRDITAYVHVCRSHFSHPFTRISTVYKYDAPEYDLAYSNPLYPIAPEGYFVYIQTNKVRGLYDTEELIDNLLDKEYISDDEILSNQGYVVNGVYGDKKVVKTARKNFRKM
ncbi:MAG: hypothetical protein GX330_05400, partial [Bacteroidales bacterium]|nr:hypothetical protein [Bacteroidales bacterium]